MHNDEFQRRVLDFQDRTGTDLATLKTRMASLIGEKQPGRIDAIEAHLKQLQASHNQGKGALHVLELDLGFVGGLLGSLLKHYV